MKLPFCPHEEKVAELLRENRWPWAADPVLLTHAGKCSRCIDVVFAMPILQQTRSASMMVAHIGSPYYLWWRAQLRRRNSTVEQVTKPLVWAEKFALICVLCIAASVAFWQWAQIGEWIGSMAGIFDSQSLQDVIWMPSVFESKPVVYSILAGLAAIACVGGLTLFTSGGKE
jgi:hypothetical protein